MFLRLLSPDGEALVSSNMSSWRNITISRPALQLLTSGTNHVFETLDIPNRKHKVRILYGIVGPDKILQMGKSLEDDERFMEAFRERFVVLMAVLMAVGALIGWFMARRALLGVEEVTQTAEDISAGDIERRVPLKSRGTEIDSLATTFNDMLDRIHGLIHGMREMTDNIAHDLRYENMAANTIEECDRLLAMIETMLDISELEAGAGILAMAEVDMTRVVEEACELFQPPAEDKGIAVVIEVPAGALVYGDIQRLQRMVAMNLWFL
jgi:signal transduction histidine kinase